jgi:putative salt-induced outer membrane protein YdiY
MLKKTIMIFILMVATSLSQINIEKYRTSADSSGFSGNVNIDITAMTGNTDFQFINLNSRLNQNWIASYTFLVANGGFGWDKGEKIFNQALAHLRHVQDLNNDIQIEAFTQYDFNKKRLLTGRELIGGGFRFKLIKQDDMKLRLGTSYFYEHENYDVPANSNHGNNLFTNRLSTYLTYELKLKEDVQLVLISYYQPHIDKWEDYRIISDNSLIVSLSSLLDINISFSLRFDSRPPETIKNTDTITKFGFGFRF